MFDLYQRCRLWKNMTEDFLKSPSNCFLLALSVSVRSLQLLRILGVKNDPSCLF